jgi:membrane protein YqaA with SNARE-associated domain
MEILISLFAVAFLAATLLPLQSELMLSALLLTTTISPLVLVATASVGNVLGSLFNWWLGCQIETYKDRRWFPVKPASLKRAEDIYKRYGRWSLLFSWVPFLGDALTLVSGVLRENVMVFLVLVTIAKAGRYICLALLLT